MIRILHLTDFHYRNHRNSLIDQENVVNKIVNKLKEETIDLIIFSGDLVNNGEKEVDFKLASELLLEKLSKDLNIDKSKIIICPGNHDMNWSERIDAIFKQLDKDITKPDELDKYLNGGDYSHSIKPLKNYLNFEKEFYDKCSSVKHIEDLYSAFEVKINDKLIGLVSINSSWRSVGLNDDNNLIFPIGKLKESLSYLNRNCDAKILVMHHPLSDFKKFNSYAIEDVIYNNFDVLFSGHVHKKETSINYTTNDGILKIVTPATLTYDGGHIGYTILNIDYEESEYQVFNEFYDSKVDAFYDIKTPKIELPSSIEKLEQNRFRKKLKKKFEIELIGANNLLVSKEQGDSENAFFDITTQPVLKTQSNAEITNQETIVPDYNWDSFINDNEDYLILGKGKCGKTILLKKIQLELLRDFSKENKIPVYIDLKDWAMSSKLFNLEEELRIYFELNKNDVKRIVKDESIVFLIDNFHLKSYILEEIAPYIENNDKIRIIACSEETIVTNIEDSKIDGRTLKKLYFHKLRKKHIRKLTNNFFKLNDEKQEEIVDKVSSIFTRLSIPFNFWSVSLFLWVFKKDLNNNFQNDVELINLYIEKLLEKEQLTVAQSNFSYDKYKRFLSSLAYELLKKHHTFSYSMTYGELHNFTESYLQDNIRYTVSSREVLEYVEDRGILMKKTDGRYTFRLKGIFEYFVANQLTYDHDLLEDLIANDDLYLSFGNEFELYAGFKRDDEEFLNKIHLKTKAIFKNVTNEYESSGSSIDNLLKSKILELNEMKPLIEGISETFKDGLSLDKQDEVEEMISLENGRNDDSQSEVTKKEVHELNESIESLEKALFILGRVFKNIDEVKCNQTVHEIFDYILDSSCYWGFKFIDDLKINDIKELLKDEHEDAAKKIIKVLTNFIPTLVQTRTNDMIGDKNLEKVINSEIKNLKSEKNTDKNQYKLFILYFLLLDINLMKYKDLIDEIRDFITIPVLRYSILLKLNFYLGFKVNKGDKELVKFLRNKIQKQQLIFNNNTDLGELHHSFSDIKKKRLSDNK